MSDNLEQKIYPEGTETQRTGTEHNPIESQTQQSNIPPTAYPYNGVASDFPNKSETQYSNKPTTVTNGTVNPVSNEKIPPTTPPYNGAESVSQNANEVIPNYYANPAISQPLQQTQPKKKKTKFIVIGIVAVLIAALAISSVFVLPKLLVSTEELLVNKKYSEAYNRADKKDEKRNILGENIAAYICENEIPSILKNPDSFKLTGIRYRLDNPNAILLEVSGENGFGGSNSSFMFFTYNEDEEDFSYIGSVSSLKEEEYSRYDSSDETTEKLLDNVLRSVIKEKYVDDKYKVDKKAVKRINKLFKQDELEDIELIKDPALKSEETVEPTTKEIMSDDDFF